MSSVPETLLACHSEEVPVPIGEYIACLGQAAGWVWAGACRIGSRHQAIGGVCEDVVGALFWSGESGQYLNLALADGVSGGARGDVAAAAMVRHSLAYRGPGLVGTAAWMRNGAESAVNSALNACSTMPGAATFAGAWLTHEGVGKVTRVGDCRAYVCLSNVLETGMQFVPLLPDQTLASMGYLPSSDKRAANPAHMVGNGCMGELDWRDVTVSSGGGILLCSDGLHTVLSSATMERLLGTQMTAWRQRRDDMDSTFWYRFCEDLIEQAQVLGSDDDIAVLLAIRV